MGNLFVQALSVDFFGLLVFAGHAENLEELLQRRSYLELLVLWNRPPDAQYFPHERFSFIELVSSLENLCKFQTCIRGRQARFVRQFGIDVECLAKRVLRSSIVTLSAQ